ncbi:MAG: DNA polymerase III subunit alpha, partial [Chloroflexi bacterium]|nr:DNA polymerase III subunit alpha [Chloroflexota bacterium]
HELKIIHDMGFETYFLIVWDLCEFARSADIWWNVRGSGAGSIAAYCLGITNIDPIQNNLLFERFLNPGRVSMPDIDLDYPDDQRAQMIAYTARKYGEDKVAAIITFGTMGAKAAVRDVGRALNVEADLVHQAARLIPTEPKPKPVKTYVEDNPELKKLVSEHAALQRIVETAALLQGISRHASTHAAGVIVADKPLVEYIPLHRQTSNDENVPIHQVTQFPMETCESIGLLKVDFLGLSTLTIMRRACELIERHHGIKYTMENIPYRPSGDPALDAMLEQAFGLLGRGETVGVFQVESSGMQQTLREMQPHQFEHIIAAIALYRPGPMENIPTFNARLHGKEPPEYLHDDLKPILAETFGIPVYQEQIMQIAGELFGYSLGDADLMRRAVSKKKADALQKHRAIFMERGPENGVSAEVASQIFDNIERFANYGFNKSHASDYAVITVQTAFLKTHYPEEYMAALLSVYFDDADRVTTLLGECKRLGIDILPPNINHSQLDFDIQTHDDGKRAIRFGLAAIKNAGIGALQHLIDERDANGPFADLTNLCQRVDLRHVGKRAMESLIKVGALSDLSDNRNQLIAALDRIVTTSIQYFKDQAVGQMGLFGDATASGGTTDLLDNLPPAEEVSQRDVLNWEKELLGLYVSSHPVDPLLEQAKGAHIITTADLSEAGPSMQDRGITNFAGLIASVRRIFTKNKDMMGILQLEDRYGSIEVVLFPRTWNAHSELAVEGEVVVVAGKFDLSRGDPQIICDSLAKEMTLTRSAEQPAEVIDDVQPEDYWPEETPAPRPSFGAANGSPNQDGGWQGPIDADETPPPPEDLFEAVPPAANGASAPPTASRCLQIKFIRSDDDDRDNFRFEKLLGMLDARPGEDRVEITLIEQGAVTHVMDFGDQLRVRYTDALVGELAAVSGIEIVPESGVYQTEG